MTVAELCAWGKPSALVPLPTSAANHQTHNARALAAAGAAIHLAEHDLSAHALAGLVTELLGEPARLEALAARARARGHPNESREIVSDRKSTRLNSSHSQISYAVFCLKKNTVITTTRQT